MPNNIIYTNNISSMPLLTGENIIFEERQFFLIPLVLILLVWAGGVFLFWLFMAKLGLANMILQWHFSFNWFVIIYFGIFLFTGLVIFLVWFQNRFVLTNKRVEWHFGVLGNGYVSIALAKIENVSSTQSFSGLIFNYGNIKIEPAGLSMDIDFNGIARPSYRRKQIEEAAG